MLSRCCFAHGSWKVCCEIPLCSEQSALSARHQTAHAGTPALFPEAIQQHQHVPVLRSVTLSLSDLPRVTQESQL